MTRAQQVFIASGIESRANEDSWYHRVSSAIEVVGTGAHLPVTDAASSEYSPENSSGENAHTADALRAPLQVGKRTDDLVDRRRRHGTLVHAVLEKCVPPAVDGRDDLRNKLEMTDYEFDALWEEVQLIVTEPQLARFFRPEHYVRAYNEFAYVSQKGELRRMDRVVEFDNEIWILDYKTGDSIDAENLEAAARPYRNQLLEYCTALGELMPGKPVKSALIFSGGLFYPM